MINKAQSILIIDDDELDRSAIIRALKKTEKPFSITEANTGEKGIALAKADKFDIILLDFRLPGRNGIEVLKELCDKLEETPPVMVLSQSEDEDLALEVIEAGAQDFILKEEISNRRLLRAIHQAQHRHYLQEELNKTHQELRRLAGYDQLTGLANRYTLELELHAASARARRMDNQLALLLLDLDKFKQVNDVYGHASGDVILKEVARRLALVVRDSDLLARLGGDEFVILAQDMARDDQAQYLAQRIIEAFDQPVELDAIEWKVTTSIGIANYDNSINEQQSLLKCADIAMYRAKQRGRNQIQFYSPELHNHVLQRTLLETQLRQALKWEQFRLYYQPQINTTNGRLNGVEALIRWEHPEYGSILPDQFLPLAEEIGIIEEIDNWVLQTACHQFAQWQKQYPEEKLRLSVSVNLSAIQLLRNNLQQQITNVLAGTGLDPAYLELEITENALIKDPVHAAEVLAEISAMGIRMALDDFGTGYSSMQHLKLFPVSTLKIDRSFIAEIGKSAHQERLLTAMIHFARTLELTVIAEGVENQEQLQFCMNNHCHLVQGYFYSVPLPCDQFEMTYLQTRH